MREYELLIDKALQNGLSPFDRDRFNEQVLHECLGLRCGQQGLEPYVELTNPIGIAIYYLWPYPQVIIGEGYTLIIVRDVITGTEDRVYSVTGGWAIYTLAATLSHYVSILFVYSCY